MGDALKRIKKIIDEAFNKTGNAQNEFINVGKLADDVKNRENDIKVSMQEQTDGGQRVLAGLEVMQKGVDSVMNATKDLQKTTDEVIVQISNIQL